MSMSRSDRRHVDAHSQCADGQPHRGLDSCSGVKLSIAQVLKDEGYIDDFAVREREGRKEISIALKYYAGRPVIERLERISRPGLRVYKGAQEIPKVMNGLGVAILSTSRGVMTDRKARATGVGGELLCIVA